MQVHNIPRVLAIIILIIIRTQTHRNLTYFPLINERCQSIQFSVSLPIFHNMEGCKIEEWTKELIGTYVHYNISIITKVCAFRGAILVFSHWSPPYSFLFPVPGGLQKLSYISQYLEEDIHPAIIPTQAIWSTTTLTLMNSCLISRVVIKLRRNWFLPGGISVVRGALWYRCITAACKLPFLRKKESLFVW